MSKPRLKEINPPGVHPLDSAAKARIAELAKRQHGAQGLLMKLVSLVGGQVEDGMKMLPAPVRGRVDGLARAALRQSYHLAARSRGPLALRRALGTDRAHKMAATLSGALGGVGGLATASVEIPIATTMIFRAVQGVAESHGEDPLAEETRLECLRVFGAGAPGEGDDGVDTAFLGARLGLTGSALHGLIAKIAPRFAALLGQKLAIQAVPVLGAAAGAGTNYAFIDYYTEVAHVHFGLRALVRAHGEDAVLDQFHRDLAALRKPLLRA
ncbi:MAG: protein EcsC [Rhodobacterales bacterium]|nr:MAG: protein EcsC [Rhodobacterales bacterium]